VITTLNDPLFNASRKNPLVPVAQRQAGNDIQFRTPSDEVFEIELLRISLAKASLVAVNPPASDIWSISDEISFIDEKS
tara:strand:- start:1233 stop:1469 length:237 start_codon:yes stop_codon:yes gene_type:complete